MPYALPRYEQVIVAGCHLTLSLQLYELEKGTFMVVYILITCGCKTMNGEFLHMHLEHEHFLITQQDPNYRSDILF